MNKFGKIEVEISDPKLFSSVCKLIDKPSFIYEINKIRKYLKIENLYSIEDYNEWENDIKSSRKENLKINKLFKTNKDLYSYFEKIENPSFNLRFTVLHNKYIFPFLKKYNRPYMTDGFILFDSVFFNKVYGEHLISRAILATNENPGYFARDVLPFEGNNAFIILNPNTNLNHVKNAYKEYKKYLKLPDTYSNIKRDREWYWLKKEGLSYKQIHDRALTSGEIITRDGIIKGVKQYIKYIN